MCTWLVKVAEKHRRLTALLLSEIRGGPVVNADETTVQVLQEPERADTSKSYMWLFRGGDPQHPALVLQYHPTRSGKVPLAVLSGYRGYVQCDGYNGYDALGREKDVTLVGCWAHARRKFDKVIKARGGQKKEGTRKRPLTSSGSFTRSRRRPVNSSWTPMTSGNCAGRNQSPCSMSSRIGWRPSCR